MLFLLSNSLACHIHIGISTYDLSLHLHYKKYSPYYSHPHHIDIPTFYLVLHLNYKKSDLYYFHPHHIGIPTYTEDFLSEIEESLRTELK